jgi:uncharacterized protein (DUF1919 family)
LKSIDYPPYRNVFTKVNNLGFSHLSNGKVTPGHHVEFEMPFIKLAINNDDNKTYMKYIDPIEYNVFV